MFPLRQNVFFFTTEEAFFKGVLDIVREFVGTVDLVKLSQCPFAYLET